MTTAFSFSSSFVIAFSNIVHLFFGSASTRVSSDGYQVMEVLFIYPSRLKASIASAIGVLVESEKRKTGVAIVCGYVRSVDANEPVPSDRKHFLCL